MARPRQVHAAGKNDDGDITSLKGHFGEVPIDQAIFDIQTGQHSYAVGDSDINVVQGATGAYLRTEPDGKTANNLDNLPDA